MECLGGGRYTFFVMTSVILSGVSSMACLGRYTFLARTSVILSDGVNMRVEPGMFRYTKRIRA